MANVNLRAVAAQAAHKYGLPVDVFMRLVNQESGFNPNAVSPVGAMGLTQLMPETAKSLGVDPRNPAQNLYGGARYLRQQLDRFGSIDKALAAYNAGPGAVAKYNGIPPYTETQHYVQSIMGQTQGGIGAADQSGLSQPAPSSAPASTLQTPQKSGPSLQALLQQAAPSDATQSILQSLGGIAAKTASRLADEPIPMPKLISKTPSGLQVQTDVQGPVHPAATGLIKQAEHYLGTPYRWGGANPKAGFDCSGFVQFLYKQQGINLPRTTYQQINVGKQVNNPKQLKPGDIIFFSKNGDVHHEGLYIGANQFIHAPHTGDVVKISSLSEPYYAQQFVGGRRVTGGKK